MKNIYDLEGNKYEWTAQAYGINGRGLRGGSYDGVSAGNFNPASSRGYYYPSFTFSYYASRVSLYVSL